MKHFFKIYFSSILLFLIVGIFAASGYMLINRGAVMFPTFGEIADDIISIENNSVTPIEKAIKKSSRLNVLVVGKEHVRTDTIMLVSYDKDSKKANVLSIPRDTYYEREGYEGRFQKKINSIYQAEGIEGLLKAVQDITKIPVDRYVMVDYNAVIKIVDMLEGVEVDVPMNMNYKDPSSDPPLEINIKAGKQTLDGENALKFLRFRQNSDGTGYPDGDLGRIKTQQEFIQCAIKKALSFKLPAIINEAFKYIDSNFTLTELLSLATNMVGFSSNNVELNVLDNYTKKMDGLSYVIPNESGIEEYLYKLYGVEQDVSPSDSIIKFEEDKKEDNIKDNTNNSQTN